jgi:hypothetical protein
MKENSRGVHSSTMYLIYCKNFCKCHNVFTPSTTIKKRESHNGNSRKVRSTGNINEQNLSSAKWKECYG